MLKTRIITAVIGVPLLLAILYLGGLAWSALFVLLAVVALYEYLAMMQQNGQSPQYLPAFMLLFLLLFQTQTGPCFTPLLMAVIMLIVLEGVFFYPQFNLADTAQSFLGAFYIGFLLHFALLIQDLPKPFLTILLIFLVTWGSDIGGYVFGRLWGKRKMTPLLSPNKTWAGAMGGVLMATLAAVGFEYFVPLAGFSLGKMIFLAAIASVAAQLGDLFESAMKRSFGVKDSGWIIPGHGGVLDRFDSFMLVLPVFYYFLSLAC